VRKPTICSLVIFGYLVAWTSAQAQTPAQAQANSQDTQKFSVTLGLTVTDSSGRVVTDLRKEDLQVFDDGNLETISYFSKEVLPITYGLLIDSSGSLKLHFGTILQAARQIIDANLDNDETFIIRFISSDKIETVQELTSDKSVLGLSLNGLKVEMGQTALIDAVYVSAQYAIKHQAVGQTRRAALVLISDGEDRASYYREEQLFELLRKSNLQVFVLGLVAQLDDDRGLIRRSPRQKATDLITKLSRETGGHALILNSAKDMPDAIVDLTQRLHSQYLIAYTPSKNVDKTNRKVQVKLTRSPEHEKWRVTIGVQATKKES